MVGKSTHLQVIPQQSAQNAAHLPLQTCDKNQWTFLLYNMGVGFDFANLGFFAKVSVPLQFIIPCYFQGILVSLPVKKYNSLVIAMGSEKKATCPLLHTSLANFSISTN